MVWCRCLDTCILHECFLGGVDTPIKVVEKGKLGVDGSTVGVRIGRVIEVVKQLYQFFLDVGFAGFKVFDEILVALDDFTELGDVGDGLERVAEDSGDSFIKHVPVRMHGRRRVANKSAKYFESVGTLYLFFVPEMLWRRFEE